MRETQFVVQKLLLSSLYDIYSFLSELLREFNLFCDLGASNSMGYRCVDTILLFARGYTVNMYYLDFRNASSALFIK